MYSGFVGFGRFTVPSPEENPILKDHFVTCRFSADTFRWKQ